MNLEHALASQEERLHACVHCGFCLPACPTYVRLGDEADSPRGRLYLMQAVVEGRLDPAADAFQTHIDRCLGCRACETVCPSGVEYGHLLERARQEATLARRPSLLIRAVLGVFASKRLLAIVLAAARLLRGTRLPAVAARLLPGGRIRLAAGMLAATAPVSAAALSGAEQDDEGPPARIDTGSSTERAGTVALLEGCVQSGLFAHVNAATERVLEANGHPLRRAPLQGCCGALHAHAGALHRARALARANIEAFESSGADFVVVNAAGCGATMKEYGELLEDNTEYAERARLLAAAVRDVAELMASRVIRQGAPVAVRVAYDAPCHLLHGQGVDDAPLALLRSVPSLVVEPLKGASECCGGAGIYGVTHPELAGRIGGDKVTDVAASGAEIVATGNPGCIMQIGAGVRARGLPVSVLHPVELLDESYRRAGYYGGG